MSEQIMIDLFGKDLENKISKILKYFRKDEVITERQFDTASDTYIKDWYKKKLHCQRELDGTALKNVIAFFVGYGIRENITEEEFNDIQNGRLFAYNEEAKAHSEKIIDSMKHNNDGIIRFRIFPVMLYFNEKMVKTVVFTVLINTDQSFIVDAFGRKYQSYDKWLEERTYPEGKIAFTEEFSADQLIIIKQDVDLKQRTFYKLINTIMSGINIATTVYGIVIVPIFPSQRGGVLLFASVCQLYCGGKEFYTLYDRYSHNQSIGLNDPEARKIYLNMLAQFSSAGLSFCNLSLITGDAISIGECKLLMNLTNICVGANLIMNSASGLNDAFYLHSNWGELSVQRRCLIFAQMSFSALSCMKIKTADQILKEIKEQCYFGYRNCLPEEKQLLARSLEQKISITDILTQIKIKTLELNISPEEAFSLILTEQDIKPTKSTLSFILDIITRPFPKVREAKAFYLPSPSPPPLINITDETIKYFTKAVGAPGTLLATISGKPTNFREERKNYIQLNENNEENNSNTINYQNNQNNDVLIRSIDQTKRQLIILTIIIFIISLLVNFFF